MSTEQRERAGEPVSGERSTGGGQGHTTDARKIGLAIAALGVVFGDIGTNPLFAVRETLEGPGHHLAVVEAPRTARCARGGPGLTSPQPRDSPPGRCSPTSSTTTPSTRPSSSISVVTGEVPRIDPEERTEIVDLGAGFHQVVLRYGFMEDIDVPHALAVEVAPKLGIDLGNIPYFLGRESLRVTARPGMARWREHLFALMSRNATSAATYFDLPPEQTVEVGLAVEL